MDTVLRTHSMEIDFLSFFRFTGYKGKPTLLGSSVDLPSNKFLIRSGFKELGRCTKPTIKVLSNESSSLVYLSLLGFVTLQRSMFTQYEVL
jgi:hypothetical protein